MGTSVLIVDDHAGFRASARRMLEAGGYDVVGEAADCAGARDAAGVLHPDVVLLDVQLPDGNGVDLAGELTTEEGAPQVVLTSSHAVDELGTALADCGARGFVPKDALAPNAIEELLS